MNKTSRQGRKGTASAPAAGSVRIIGGRWRGTRLQVPSSPGLRPTSDRVRETLFNWLAPSLPGARVLDLFAGSGALGLEAMSRGASSAVLVESDAGLAQALVATAARLGATGEVAVHRADALRWLAEDRNAAFDVAFVDPPFDADLWDAVLAVLPQRLAGDAWLYVEAPLARPASMPQEWALHREGATREVRYALYRRVTLDAPLNAGGPATP